MHKSSEIYRMFELNAHIAQFNKRAMVIERTQIENSSQIVNKNRI